MRIDIRTVVFTLVAIGVVQILTAQASLPSSSTNSSWRSGQRGQGSDVLSGTHSFQGSQIWESVPQINGSRAFVLTYVWRLDADDGALAEIKVGLRPTGAIGQEQQIWGGRSSGGNKMLLRAGYRIPVGYELVLQRYVGNGGGPDVCWAGFLD